MTIESRAFVLDADDFAKMDQSGIPHTHLPRFDNRKEFGEDSVDIVLYTSKYSDREGSENSPDKVVWRWGSHTPRPDDREKSRATYFVVPALDCSTWKRKYEIPAEWSNIGMFTANLVSRLGWESHTLEELARSQNVRPMVDVFALFRTCSSKGNYGFKTALPQKELVEDRERELLVNRLWAAFEADPLEDGISHPAEEIVGEALRSMEDKPVLDWFRTFSLDAERPSFAASVLRCLGRQTPPGTDSWRAELVRDGLFMEDVEIRDAAVQAAESWGDRGLADVMKKHREDEPWLRDYIEDVISDLGE